MSSCPGWIDTPDVGHNRCVRPAEEPHERHVDETGLVEWTDPPWRIWVQGRPLNAESVKS